MKISFELMFEVEESEDNQENAKAIFENVVGEINNYFNPKWLFKELNFIKEVTRKDE